MADEQDLKSRLTYNHDLSGVLRRLDRRTPFSRHRLANDPITAAYIAAGMRLIQQHLGPSPQRVRNDPEDENSLERPLWGFLSQRAVAAEVAILEQFAGMMEALSMGYALRRLSDPAAFGIDREQNTSRLGTAALALLVGCLEHADDERRGTSVEDSVRDLVYGHSPNDSARVPADQEGAIDRG